MSLEETLIDESIKVACEIMTRIVDDALGVIRENLFAERVPQFTAQFFTSIIKEELRTPMMRYDVGERPDDLKEFWMPDEEPSAHDVDSLAKHFVKISLIDSKKKDMNHEISLQSLDNASLKEDPITNNKKTDPVKSVFDNSKSGLQKKISRQSLFVGSNAVPENGRSAVSPIAMVKYANSFKQNAQKTLKHSKSQTLRMFLSKPPITPVPFNKGITLVKVTEAKEVDETEQTSMLLTSGKLIGNTKTILDNVFINKKEEEFRAIKNIAKKSVSIAPAPRPTTIVSPKNGKSWKTSFEKSGFDINGEKIMYKDVKEEDLNQNNFTQTSYAEKRGRSALPMYVNGSFIRRIPKGGEG